MSAEVFCSNGAFTEFRCRLMSADPNSIVEVHSSDSEQEASSSARPSNEAGDQQGGQPALRVPSTSVTTGCSMLWGELSGHGLCKGSNGLPCYFGENGHPANAGPNGRCDLCSGEAMRGLHEHMPQRLTHILTKLQGRPLQHALIRIKLVLGESIKNDYQHRRDRALHRRNPDRPTRGPRTKTTTSE